MILLALNTFLATPGCVSPDGAATLAAQQWGAYALEAAGESQAVPFYVRKEETVSAGSSSQLSGASVGFTWFADSMTLVVEDSF